MRGLRAPTVASFGEGNLLGGQQPQCSAVLRVSESRRLVFVAVLVSAGLALGAAALAAAPYSLLGREAPDFGLHAVAGSNVRLSEYRGEVVVLSFWGSRCAPCRTQLDALDKSLQTYQSAGLKVLAINVDDDQTRALEFAKDRSVAFPLLLDPEKSVSRRYQVDNLPMTLLVDRSGIVRYVHRDYSGKEEALYLQQLRTLLNE
jgi:peroxiredoxin